MEDGFPLFDPNNEAERQEQKLREYYNSFSDNARRRLLSKTVIRPTSVYDILYPNTREVLLAKNVPINNDLEESAKIIRDRLIAKIVTEETDLEKISADFRNSLLARAKIQDDRNKLVRNTEAYRKTNLAKNTPKDTDLEKDSNFARINNTSKNKPNPSLRGDIEENSEFYKVNNISKNTPKDQDLLRDSDAFRTGDVHKNVPNKSDLEKDSDAYRHNNLAKNAVAPKSMQEIADTQRAQQLAKNAHKPSDIESESSQFRADDISKNASKEQDLLRDSEDIRNQFRKTDVNKNVPNKSDLESDSVAFRKNNTSSNKPNVSNIETDSEVFRSDDLSLNKPKASDLENDSVQFRTDDLSLNKSKASDLEVDSAIFRTDDLSLNKPKTSNLEVDSADFRANDLSLNKSKKSNIEVDSSQFRADDLSRNKPKKTNLESDSVPFRFDDLSFNKPNISNLEVDSAQFRVDDLSINKTKLSNLEKDSANFRADDISKNKPNSSNIEIDSIPFRNDDLSFNKPSISNLETDSVIFRDDDLSLNNPNTTDLESDSVQFRYDDLSLNTLILTDLENDSIQFREDDLAANTPSVTDLATDSTPFLYNNLSSNVPNLSDLEVDSIPFRSDDLSANISSTSNLLLDSFDFRNDDLAANVAGTSDLLTDSIPFRALDLAANIPINSNIASDSVQFRDDAIASNISFDTDLLLDSQLYRKDAVSKNAGYGLLGINVQGAGTSAFLGISRVFTQGILVRQLLFSKNKSKNTNLIEDSSEFKENNVRKNEYIYGTNEYTSANATKLTSGNVISYFGGSVSGDVDLELNGQLNYNNYFSKKLQELYGQNSSSIENGGSKIVRLGGGFFSTSINPSDGGGLFVKVGNPASTTYNIYQSEGSITSGIRNYSLERSVFNLHSLQPGSLESLDAINGNESLGFQQLINSTIGSFRGNKSVGSQSQTNTTPSSIVTKNEGVYYKGGNKDLDILKAGANSELGSAESMMSKTVIGNPFEDEDFFAGRRGVKHIVNTIKSSDNPIANNFDPQNNRAYIIGSNRDGSPKVARQRYTIANPYAPGQAGKLLFSIKNYASGQQFYFPPYIKSIQNTESASWNTTNFLGRPEAMYTYNNSSRNASISFYVLTDYSQSVDIGRDWGSEDMSKITATFDSHFTDSDVSQNDAKKLNQEKLRKLKAEQQVELENIEKKKEQNSIENVATQSSGEIDAASGNGSSQINAIKSVEIQNERAAKRSSDVNSSEDAAFETETQRIRLESAKTTEAIGDEQIKSNRATNYSESNRTSGNINTLNVTKMERNGSEIISKAADTIDRINTLKSGLMFQPAFFSGDKVDFVRKVEFLSKLTRPSAAPEQPSTGFSFTKPPISHIRLGDWWDHDIVVNSVSYDYADSPWTLEGGRVQPMWVLVSIDFNIIGPFGSATSRPPLATDNGGMYSPIS